MTLHLPAHSRAADLAAAAAIAAVFLGGWFLVGGGHDVPVIDDWLYAGSVEQLLRAGRFSVPPFSAVYPIAQILWGALFSLPFGFSFVALRASTVCLAAAGCIAVYGIAREMGGSRAVSLLVALAVALDPVFFVLSYSFMTDVPFVGVSMIALYFAVSGARRDDTIRWSAAAVMMVIAFLIRPLAIGLPAAAFVLVDRRRWGARWLMPLAVSIALMVAFWLALPHAFGRLDIAEARVGALRWWSMIPPRRYAEWNAHLAIEGIFPLTPLVVAALMSRRVLAIAGAIAAALAIALWVTLGAIPFPLPDTQTWTMQDFAARTLVACRITWRPWAVHAAPWLSALALVVVAGTIVGFVRAARVVRVVGAGGSDDHGTAMLLAFGVVQWVLVNALWLYNDRYYIVFAPVIAYAATRIGRVRLAVAGVLLAMWGAVGVTGARDMLAFNAAVAGAVGRLEASGVRPADIDAGYVSNGWRLYIHPDRLGPGADRRYDVPFVTSDALEPYRLANCPEPGYEVVEAIGLPAVTWQATNHLYVLRKTGTGVVSAGPEMGTGVVSAGPPGRP